MVKKKSFWLILLTVLTAVVLAFCACGLVGCSSESDDNNDSNDDTQQGGGDGGSGDQGSGDGGSGSGDSGSGSGDTGSGSGSGDSGSGSGSGSSGTEGDGSFTLQGVYNAYGSDFWGSIEFDADGTGYFGTYWGGTSSGATYDSFSGDITWEYTDEDETEIEAEMTIQGTSTATFPVSLHKVNGQVVAGTVYIEEINSESIFYEANVAAALESKGNVSGSHAQLVLYYDLTGMAVIGGEVQTASWEWTSDKDGISVTIGSSTYSTTSAVVNGENQITQAVFGTFGDASDITFLQIGDEALLDTTVATFVSEEGYTLVLYEGYVFETTVNGTTYTGEYNPTSYMLDYNDGEETYTPTVSADEDGNPVLTYATYFGNTSNVVFTVPVAEPSREDSETYQTYYNHAEYGTAIAVLTGVQVKKNDDGIYEETNDGVEYWTFLYSNGEMIANVYDGASSYVVTTGNWTWGIEDEEDENAQLVPVLNRNYNTPYYAYENEDESWSVVAANASSSYSGNYYCYTFDLDDFPAGWFIGTSEDETDETTYYVVLYSDGTFVAHIGGTLSTSNGYWAKNEDGTMEFGKNSWSTGYGACEQTTDDTTGLITVTITNARGTSFYYVIDPTIVPVGGYDMSEFETT